jgi:acyl transferase domain-containing protein/acyl carrier protein
MAGRFPGAPDIESFWNNIVNGVESLTYLEDDGLRAVGVPEHRFNDRYYIRLKPLLDDVAGFDARLFGFNGREAQVTDPQQRVFLEVCHTALEHAGCAPDRYSGRIGVYGGGAPNSYMDNVVHESEAARQAVGDLGIEISNASDYIATRVAYALDLTGPAISVETACSTALVAVHLASRAIRAGECEMALAGAVNIRVPDYRGEMWAENSVYARDGHVRAFDAGASGTNFGFGAGVVVLKDLRAALADGDTVYAVVAGSAINNDGAARSSFSAPSVEGQREVILAALRDAGDLAPDTIGYVEAHGTGTQVGDPIEVTALTEAYRAAGGRGVQQIPIGSVKTNIGHLGAAAGAPALIKVVLAMANGTLPPSLHFEKPNPAIDFVHSPFHVNRHARPWPTTGGPMRAGVSGFGIGGTNAHLILESPPADGRPVAAAGAEVLPLSARTATALQARVDDLAAFLTERPETPLADVAHTLQTGRTAHVFRAAVVASSTSEAAASFPAVTATKAAPSQGVTFLFSGQGSQYVGMARELQEREPVFRDAMAECADGLLPHLGFDLRDVVFGEESEDLTARLQQTQLTQPALFAVEYSLAELWAAWGVEPTAMLGHSVGEIVAACRSGVFTLDAALAFVAARGRLIQSMPIGSMLAVPLPEEDVRVAMPAELAVAAVNAPRSTVVSGPAEVIAEFESTLARIGVPGTPLVTSHAFHSAMLDPALEELAAAAEAAKPGTPSTPYISTVTGDWITDGEASDPGYWARQARLPVRFAAAVATAASSTAAFVEVGPGRALASLVAQSLGGQRGDVTVISSLGAAGSQRRDAQLAMLDAAARLWTEGVPVEWARVSRAAHRRRIALPTYPYERQRFWVEPYPEPAHAATDHADRADLDAAARVTSVPAWRQRRLDRTAATDEAEQLLVFTPGIGPVEELARVVPVIRVDLGDRFEQVGERHFRMSPSDRDDYASLLKALDAAELRPTTIVHGWVATPSEGDPLDPSEVSLVRRLGFDSVTALCQAVALRWPSREIGLRIVTNLACNVSGTDPVEPAKALLRGLAKTAPIELSNLSCQMIDLDGGPAHGALLAEVGVPITDTVVAIRGGRRWAEDFGPAIGLPERVDLPRALRRRGVYLVTGGLGDVGLRTAEELARTAAARIVLLGRTPFPGRDDWDDLVTGEPSRTTEVIARIRQLESHGAEVMTVAADVADETSMRAAIAAVHEHFGPVNGVFHAAGVAGGGLLAMKSQEQANEVLRPKVDGLLTIDRLLGEEVELLMLYSSIFAITGGFGQSDYAAANSFLDAYAQSCSDRAARVQSVDYCGWLGHGMVNADARVASTWLQEVEPATEGLLGDRVPEHDEPVFHTSVGPSWHWVLTEHQMAGQSVFPGTSYVDMIATAFRRTTGAEVVELRDVLFGQPLVIDGHRELKVEGTVTDGGGFAFTVSSRPTLENDEAAWQRHASATAKPVVDADEPAPLDVEGMVARCTGPRWSPDLTNPDNVVVFGPHWDVIESVALGKGEQVSRLRLPDGLAEDLSLYTVHPSLLDCATALSLYRPEVAADDESFLPIAYDRIVVWGPLGTEVVSHLTRRGGAKGISSYDVTLADADGTVRVAIEGFAVKAVNVGEIHGGLTGSGAASVPALGIVEDEHLISADDAVDLLWRILDDDRECQHVVSVEPLPERVRRMAGLAQRVTSALESADTSRFVDSRERTAGASEGAGGAPQTSTESELLSLWRDAFALSDLGVEEDFFELGGNSLVAVQLAVRAREAFGVEVPGVAVMEYPTVRTMAAFIASLLPEPAASVS